MAKTIKISTLKRALKKIGFEQSKFDENTMLMLEEQSSLDARLWLQVHDNAHTFIIKEGRWKNAPNVHIVSYWSIPRDMKELRKTIQNIIEIYSTLCGTKFEGCIPELE